MDTTISTSYSGGTLTALGIQLEWKLQKDISTLSLAYIQGKITKASWLHTLSDEEAVVWAIIIQHLCSLQDSLREKKTTKGVANG